MSPHNSAFDPVFMRIDRMDVVELIQRRTAVTLVTLIRRSG